MEDAAITLPHNREAEEFILGGVLLENAALDAITEKIVPTDFYSERHRIIFEEMLALREKGLPIDFVSLSEAIEARSLMDKVGGASYIAQLADRIPTTANLEYYADLMRDKAILRALISGAGEIIKLARAPVSAVAEAVESAEQIIFNINKELGLQKKGLIKAKGLVNDLFKKIESIHKGELDQGGVPTGFMDMNTILMGGLHPTDLIIVAGRPSMGKTSLAMNIAEHVALTEKVPVAVFSLEMGQEQLLLRLLASHARVDQTRLRNSRFLGKEDWSKLVNACGELYEAPLYIDDTPGISPMEMRAKLRRLALNENLGLIVVDYLQLMTSRVRTDSREQEISDISRSLKAIAKEFHLPVIALSQLNRRVEERGDKRPMMSDLRESGAIEQDADIICFIYRDEVYNPETEHKGEAEIIIAKHRNGPTGHFKLRWDPELTKFESLDETYA
ncbi:MAG: replicative DNA helicase [Syntrophaceae bacterium]